MSNALILLMSVSWLVAAEVEPLAVTRPADAVSSPDNRHSFALALAHAPAVQAAFERLVAAQRAAPAADRFADPQLAVGYARSSSALDSWPMYEAQLAQPLPRWGERNAQRARASADISLHEVEVLDNLGDIAAETATLVAEADAARAQLALIDKQLQRTSALQTSVDARIAAGNASMAERLSIQSRLAALAIERQTQQRLISDAEEDVRAYLGLAEQAPLPMFAAPDKTTIYLDRVPGVLSAHAKNAAAAAQFQEARASRYPETSVGIRLQHEQEPGDAIHTIGFTLGISLPIWQGASRAVEDAALSQQRAAQRDAAVWRQRAQAQLDRAQRAATVATNARAAAQATAARLDAEYEALVRAAAVRDGANFAVVLEVLDRVADAERLVIEAEVSARRADARLWRLSPPDLSQDVLERSSP